MTSAPPTPWVVSKTPPAWQIRLSPDSDPPTEEDETEILRNAVIRRTAGAEPDSIKCVYDLAAAEERLQDLETPTDWSRQVEVAQALEEAGEYQLLAAGELLEQEIELNPEGERVQVTAMVPPFWFGAPLVGPLYLRVEDDTVYTLHDDLVFNPMIDGIVEPNRSSELYPEFFFYIWLHPESRRTSTAGTAAQGGATRESWSLKDCVETICFACNLAETYITNPDTDYLEELFADAPAVKNIRLKRNQYLPELLDALLKPHGFWWYLKPEYDDAGERKLSIRIFRLNEGRERELYHAKPGVRVNFTNSNTPGLSVTTSLLEMANQVYGEGAFPEREITLELYRGWIEDDDEVAPETLNRTHGANFPSKPNAWRKWVGNEAGDYCELRTTVAAIPDTPLDLSSVLGSTTIPRRRTFSDPLTQETEVGGATAIRRRQPYIEWYDGAVWAPAPGEWGARVLENELGVYFAADDPPADLIAAGEDAKVRITATIRGDTRLNYTAPRQTSSPLGGTLILSLDLSDKFFDRQIQSSGDYASLLAGSPSADTRNDATALQNYVTNIRTVEDAALLRAAFRLHGIHLQYEIGDILTKVAGRNISFNRKSAAAATKVYLQVAGITWDYGAQTTQLIAQAVEEQVLG